MKNRYKFFLLSTLLVGCKGSFAAEAAESSSFVDRASLDAQMVALHEQLTAVKEKMKTIVRPEEKALYEVAKGKGPLEVEDITGIQAWGKEALVSLKEQEKRLKTRIATIAFQIKSLKREVQVAESTPSHTLSPAVVLPVGISIPPAQMTRLSREENIKQAAREKQKWIKDTRCLIIENKEELRRLENRFNRNAGVLPEDTLARLTHLRKQSPELERGLRDLVEHEEGLERFLALNGLAGFLAAEAKEVKEISVESDDDGDSPSKHTRSQVKYLEERHVSFGTHYVAPILPNNPEEGAQEPDLAAACMLVDSQRHDSVRGRRDAALPEEMPTVEGNTLNLPLGGGLVTAQSELVTVPSARSEKLRARRGTGINLVPSSTRSTVKRSDAFLVKKS